MARRERAPPRALAGAAAYCARRRRRRQAGEPPARRAARRPAPSRPGCAAAPGGSACALNRSSGSDSLPQVRSRVGAAAIDAAAPGICPSPSAGARTRAETPTDRTARTPCHSLCESGRSARSRLRRYFGQRRRRAARSDAASVGSLPPLSSRCRSCGGAGEQPVLRELSRAPSSVRPPCAGASVARHRARLRRGVVARQALLGPLHARPASRRRRPRSCSRSASAASHDDASTRSSAPLPDALDLLFQALLLGGRDQLPAASAPSTWLSRSAAISSASSGTRVRWGIRCGTQNAAAKNADAGSTTAIRRHGRSRGSDTANAAAASAESGHAGSSVSNSVSRIPCPPPSESASATTSAGR